ncbi:MAG: ion transporter [Methylococcales symbiont of Hymedesmia sp. n. MRB-2018]|nr:MAG: ion transporter [Methylococcales symbiont of Hymedesmia sp. n. MRB-2018]KAF3984073.1 MAG: ion transporter [Methylococcales symbiont of Hymedesmia sp. n. MRB-2018]
MKKEKLHYHEGERLAPWRESLHTIIFGAESRLGRAFDVALIISIVCSVLVVMLGTVAKVNIRYGEILFYMEWFFTLLFTLEYGLRLLTVRRPLRYTFSFFGIVDFISIIPAYLAFFFPSIKYMLVIRILRLLRIFRVLKLSAYMGEADILVNALAKSGRKIMVFLYTILTLVVIFGALMYTIEGSQSGFTSIPKSVYWAVVTLTTVGYGDIAPQSSLGQIIAVFIMIMGYGIIAVPTGIYSAELIKTAKSGKVKNNACPDCGETGHDFDADFCKYCGHCINS